MFLVTLALAGCAAPSPSREEPSLKPAAVELLIIEGTALPRVQPPPPREGVLTTRLDDRPVPIAPRQTDVKARLTLYVGTVTVVQQYRNPFDRTIDAVYSYPLPDDAGVRDFVLRIGERRIRGIIRERDEARKIYREARRQGYVASLLTLDGLNTFTQEVSSIEPGAQIDVQITYFHALRYSSGSFEFFFPMVAGDLAMEVAIDAGAEIADITSPSHAIRVDGTRVTLGSEGRSPVRDFVLRYRVAGGQIRASSAAADGYFALMVHPPDARETVTGLRFHWGTLEASEVFPPTIPDLAGGRPVIVTGRYGGRLPAKVRLTGRSDGKPFEMVIDVREDASGGTALATIWARAKIASLTSRDEIRRLALQYGLLSNETAFVTVDSMTGKTK
jgi:hypothetical protein